MGLEYCEVCCGDHVCLLFLLELPLVLLLPQCCAWPRSCPSVPARGVDHRRSATMSNASLFCGTLEPTRMRWECGQVRVTRLRKGSNCAGVQRCQVCAPINKQAQRERGSKKQSKKQSKETEDRATGRVTSVSPPSDHSASQRFLCISRQPLPTFLQLSSSLAVSASSRHDRFLVLEHIP